MSPLRRALVDYLAVRRSLGYTLNRTAKLLDQFLAYCEQRNDQHLRLETMLAWATLPGTAHPNWTSARLSTVRQFAVYVHASDPLSEVPPPDALPWRPCRATPYLYSDQEVAALLVATDTLRTSHRMATFRTLIALLAVTGMRVGEASPSTGTTSMSRNAS